MGKRSFRRVYTSLCFGVYEKKKPELIYIAYAETDDFAHDGDYSAYLKSANTTDGMLKELWNFTQSDSFYKGNTVFIVTTDHGRGTEPLKTWRRHGKNIDGADQVWLIVFGNNIKVKGEVLEQGQLHSISIAPTVLSILDVAIDNSNINGKILDVLVK
ncbi:sulfatase-like hydrolase/transferase [Polaribacter filamentus]|uniref:sulfatase-like hydrolase/transferase n=1 Tax=Polaribacter filamentus TaxID=53483 RepID=UPI001F0C9BE9|nr:sulfatase-like hydrolase/transferase [Polaribacter filamentus]